MKKISLFIVLFFLSCQPSNTTSSGWQKVYKNDKDGKALFGNKNELMEAVRLGYPIRIGFGGSRVEHVAEADFLTILSNKEVFAQIKPIIGQQPIVKGDTMKLAFRTNNKWTKIAGTNGYSTALMIDYLQDTIVNGGQDRQGATVWYVNYPENPKDIEAKPLWRSDSPIWEQWNKK